MGLLQNWINLYPTIKTNNRAKYLIKDLVLQNNPDYSSISGYYNYLAYLNTISVDLWRVIRDRNDEQ